MEDKYVELEQSYREDTVGRKYNRKTTSEMPPRTKGGCSDVVEHNLNKPMSRLEFLSLPKDLRKVYIDFLRQKFRAGDARIAEMLGMSASAFSMQAKRAGARQKYHFKPSELKAEAWKAFLHGAHEEECAPEVRKPEMRVAAKQLHLEIIGKFDASFIEQMILLNFNKEDNVKVSITVSLADA